MTINNIRLLALAGIAAKIICLGLLFGGFGSFRVLAEASSLAALQAENPPKWGDFGQESASLQVRNMAAWVTQSGDNQNMPFVIVDKKNSKVFVFHANGQLRGAAPALLGQALGDVAAPGIGNQKLADIRPDQRITPAGRFLAMPGHNLRGVEILWVDYSSGISLHPVITSNPAERRLQRLASASPAERRISYGCINVPEEFYKNVVSKTFKATKGIVYILPEVSAQQ